MDYLLFPYDLVYEFDRINNSLLFFSFWLHRFAYTYSMFHFHIR